MAWLHIHFHCFHLFHLCFGGSNHHHDHNHGYNHRHVQQIGFVHAEDHFWSDGHFNGNGKAWKSVSLGQINVDQNDHGMVMGMIMGMIMGVG